jgi:exonuclease III
MPHVYKIGTININGITAASCLQMLEQFIRCHDFDVLLLQEVKTTHIEDFTNYITHVNMGDERRGTAILIKEGLNTGTLKRQPSGRGMTLYVQNICIITVYAPSGAEKGRERERELYGGSVYINTANPNGNETGGGF